MSLLEQTQSYWRNSQTLRGLREGYPKVAEGLMSLISENTENKHLKKLCRLNSSSRFYAEEVGRLLNLPTPKSRALVPITYANGIDGL